MSRMKNGGPLGKPTGERYVYVNSYLANLMGTYVMRSQTYTYIHTYIYIYILFTYIYMCICIYKYKYINILSCSCLLALGIENYFLDRRTDPRMFGTDYPRISRLFARHLSDVNPDRSHIESA